MQLDTLQSQLVSRLLVRLTNKTDPKATKRTLAFIYIHIYAYQSLVL